MTTVAIMGALVRANVLAQLQYRFNFVLWLAVGIAFQMTGFFFLWALLARFQSIGDWTLADITFLYGLRLLSHSLAVLIFGGVQTVDWMVREGEMDKHLVRPLPPLLIALSWFRPSAVGDLLGGVTLFVVSTRLASLDSSPIAIVYLLFAIAGATLLEGAARIACASLSFRIVQSQALLFFVDTMFNNFGNLPLRIFGGLVEVLLTFVLPVAFVAYIPASVVLGRTSELSVQPAVAYLAPAVGFIAFVAALWFWHHELPQYKSTGS